MPLNGKRELGNQILHRFIRIIHEIKPLKALVRARKRNKRWYVALISDETLVVTIKRRFTMLTIENVKKAGVKLR